MKTASRDSGGGGKEQEQGEYIEQALQMQQGGVTWAKSYYLTLSSPAWGLSTP